VRSTGSPKSLMGWTATRDSFSSLGDECAGIALSSVKTAASHARRRDGPIKALEDRWMGGCGS
jgi:hypothetical protein